MSYLVEYVGGTLHGTRKEFAKRPPDVLPCPDDPTDIPHVYRLQNSWRLAGDDADNLTTCMWYQCEVDDA